MTTYRFKTPSGFYVYAYLRKDGSPYYIGKGRDRRAIKKHNVNVPLDHSRIIICEQNLTEIGALALERRLIQWYGRVDNNTGILRNITSGGEGIEMTPSIRDKISKAHTGVPKPGVAVANARRVGKPTSLVGSKQTESHKNNISKALTGKTRSSSHCNNISKAKRGKPLNKIVCRVCDRKEMSLQHYGYWLKRLNVV